MDPAPTPGGTRFGVPSHRKEITARLSEAYSQDMLDQREFERRVERAEAAETIEELNRLVADFGAAVPRQGSRRSVSEALGEKHFTVLSSQNHIVDAGDLPGLHSVAILGEVKVDLRAFRGSGKTLVLRLSGGLSEVSIRVPAGTKVVRRDRLILGEFRHVLAKRPGQVRQLWDRYFGSVEQAPDSPFPADGPPPTLVLEGFRILGQVTVEEALP